MEKLFGISSVSKVLQKTATKTEKNKYINCIKPLIKFGYSPLHESIIGKLNADNYFVYAAMIRDYIVPVINGTLEKCLYGILYYLDRLSNDARKQFIQKVKSDIKNSPLLALSEFPYIIVNNRKSDREFYIKCINKFAGIPENMVIHRREKGNYSFLCNSIYGTSAEFYPQHQKHLRKKSPDTDTWTTIFDCNIYDLTF